MQLTPEAAQNLQAIRAWTTTHRSRHMRGIRRWLEAIDHIVQQAEAPPAPPHRRLSYALHPFGAPVLIQGHANAVAQWLARPPLLTSSDDLELWGLIQSFVQQTQIVAYDSLGK